MARRIRIIGIGAGNPDHLTIQAIDALNSCDVLFLPTKGGEKAFLAEMRRGICRRFVTERTPRILEFSVPKRRDAGDYGAVVSDWHADIAEIYEKMLIDSVGEDETVGLLVWGDPMLYDSTIRIVEQVRAFGRLAFDYDVIAGITSLQALCAGHRIPLNRIGLPVEITTGRRLAEGWPDGVHDVAVMLDGIQAFRTVADPEAEIHWGAYLGTPMEILICGRLSDVAEKIAETRRAAREEHGWIMDTYLIRRPAEAREDDEENGNAARRSPSPRRGEGDGRRMRGAPAQVTPSSGPSGPLLPAGEKGTAASPAADTGGEEDPA